MESVGYYSSPLGTLRITYDKNILLTLDFHENPDSGAIPKDAQAWLDRYFAGEDPGPIPSFRLPKASAFRRTVWELLQEIPYGQTVTYGSLADKMVSLGFGRCPQAVGGAVGSNPISLMIPCHRVIGAGGKLTGYAWGLERKKALLNLEQGIVAWRM